MDSFFGRRKGRSRQSSVTGQDLGVRSVPYDKLGPSTKSPVPAATVSQGFRNSTASNISAPMTNPTLTSDGTELNLHAMQRSRSERERAYERALKNRSQSPHSSLASSATLYNDEAQPPMPAPATLSHMSSSNKLRRSEASSSGRQSPSLSDFGHMPPPRSPAANGISSAATIRPTSSMTVMTSRSDGNRGSKHSSVLPSESHHSHLSQHLAHRQATDEFEFPRPSDEEVEALFDQVRLTRDLGELPDLPTEQKWKIVYNAEQMRWREEREQSRKPPDSAPGITSYAKDTPEWYIKKFLDQTITPKQAASLTVSLRTGAVRFVIVAL